MAINATLGNFFGPYSDSIINLPDFISNFVGLFLIVLLIFLYGLFVWKFYRLVSTRNIIELNLNQYNRSSNPTLAKLVAGLFYFVEYMVILPFLIFFWFSIFTGFLIVLTEELPISALLLISAVVIAAVRMAAYYNENLAQDMAKLIPFTLLSVSVLDPTFFSFNRIINQTTQLPSFFENIFTYLFFIIFFEMFLRFLYFIFSLFGIEEEDEEKSEKTEKSAT